MPGASALRLERPGDAHQFERSAGEFLRAREAENNLALGMISSLTTGPRRGTATPSFWIVRDGQRVAGVAMRLGLWLILAAGTDQLAVPLIVEDVIRAEPDAPGVVGPKDLAREAAALWSARTGVPARLNVAERIYRLERVIPPRPSSGAPRVATAADRVTIASWFQAFVSESIPCQDASRETAERNADRWIAGGGLWVWVDGEPVAMAGASGRTPNGVRISAVYTPPERRQRGYASSLVAALSQAELAS